MWCCSLLSSACGHPWSFCPSAAQICPACGHAWSATLDIVAYLWDELDDWAQDLLAEVHVPARHYAWSERDILALTPVRRRFYLDLLQA